MTPVDRKARYKDGLGQLMKNARDKTGYTQKQLADELGLDYYTMISQMENGYMAIPPALWEPLAVILRMDDPKYWVLSCLREYQQDVYDALFDKRSKKEVSSVLRLFLSGKLDKLLLDQSKGDPTI